MHDLPTTIVGLLHVALRIPVCNSLKEKRSVVKPCIHHLRRELNLAVAEIGDQDVWRSAVLAMTTVSNDKTVVESTLREAREYLDRRHDLEVVDVNAEIL
jgi:uncharacterized protein